MLLAVVAFAAPEAGLAQGGVGHPLPERPRSLAERLERADAVALVTVESVGTARLRVRREELLLGETPERFTVKRAPAAPPPLAEGDRAILLLRGARPPYVLVDEPSETIRLADASAEARWLRALRTLRDHAARPERLAEAYASWIDEGPETLRQLGFWALVERFAADPEGFGAIARERARAAADPALPAEARRRSAALATRTGGGTGALLEALAAQPEAAEPGVVETALREGARHERPELERALRATLGHESAPVRRAALRALKSGRIRPGPELTGLVERMARADPSDSVRRGAESWLASRRASP